MAKTRVALFSGDWWEIRHLIEDLLAIIATQTQHGAILSEHVTGSCSFVHVFSWMKFHVLEPLYWTRDSEQTQGLTELKKRSQETTKTDQQAVTERVSVWGNLHSILSFQWCMQVA
jgi:hypothetical protein